MLKKLRFWSGMASLTQWSCYELGAATEESEVERIPVQKVITSPTSLRHLQYEEHEEKHDSYLTSQKTTLI